MKLHLKQSRGNNSDNMKARVAILVRYTSSWLFYITVMYDDYILKGIQVKERTRICIKSIKGEIVQRVLKRELSFFLHATHRHDLFYIAVKYHHNIPNGIQIIELTRKCLRTDVWTDVQTTDGRQAHRYIPRTFWSGIKSLRKSS